VLRAHSAAFDAYGKHNASNATSMPLRVYLENMTYPPSRSAITLRSVANYPSRGCNAFDQQPLTQKLIDIQAIMPEARRIFREKATRLPLETMNE
jgi:hypothetical protein